MADNPNSAAANWSAFAGIMMVVGGGWWIIVGLSAVVDEAFYVAGPEYIFQFDATTWGWIHLLLGIVVLLAGLAIFTGAVWARTVGVIIAVLWAILAFSWLPWHPIWAISLIAISVFVIWALTAHGRDIAHSDVLGTENF